MTTKKKLWTTVCVFLLSAALLLTLFACVNDVTGQTGKNSPPAKKVYAFSAMTSAAMMGSAFADGGAVPQNVSAGLLTADANGGTEAEVGTTEPNGEVIPPETGGSAEGESETTDGESGTVEGTGGTRPEAVSGDVEELKKYIEMFEGYLMNNGVNEQISAPTEADGEYAAYTVKVTMEVPKLDGTKEVYTMYYSEFDQKTDIKIDYDEDDEEEGKDAEANEESAETETSTRLEGVMILGGAVYPVEGRKNVETEEGEAETEITFTTRLKDGDTKNYIEVKQSVETETGENEVEYEYKVVKDGKTVSKTKIEIETDTEENEEEVKLTFFDKSADVPSKTTYEFERETAADGTAEIVIKYNQTGKPAGVIRVHANPDGTYAFQYENGYEEDLD